ncbi:4-hydroxybenzoate transporter [Burkholderia multivorans]|uniref:4-hydroxybenzoate transporter n=1 Tax=Burkholderia multivorans TaxID=87883 RepID=A0ABD7LCS1_9BURK|nr:MFS transporter [Burkholderia multivorans]SAJ98215.1 4-hydroxybenzoate transporter [Burkholderia multivorans]SAK01086.1 4-hydroxybenzoate transporter [Burkholderia multivorans]HEF5155002.1 MFS transporter [Burkholderia multivorans]
MTTSQRTLDVQSFIDAERFSPCQWLILILCFLVVAADGYDTAAIGFIAPALVQDWGIARSALGPVMSAALAGLGIGALAAGPCADRLGRKTVLVLSVACFGAWSLVSAHAQSIGMLTAFRFLTGLGLGAAMPNAVTLMSEYAPARIRGVAVNAMFCGFSCGLAVGGITSAWLIPHFGWQSVLSAGGIGPIVLAIALAMLLPESAQYLAVRQGTHERIARILARIAPRARFDGCTFVAAEARAETGGGASALAQVLSGRFRTRTLLLWAAYFMGLLIYYLITNWMPTLFRDAGFDTEHGALMTSLFPLGGVLGNLCAGWLMDRFNPNRTIVCAYVVAGALVLVVSRTIGHAAWLGTLIFLCGTVVTSAVTSMSAYAASLYPTRCRATGVAWMLGIGRIGGVAGAFVGAMLMGLGWRFGDVFSLLAVPALAAAGALYMIGGRRAEGAEQDRTAGPAVQQH